MTEIRAVYEGIDFKANQSKNNTYILYSNTPVDGFEKYENNKVISYFKIVSKNKLDSIYKMRKLCEYNGKIFDYYEENDKSKISLISDEKFEGASSPSPGEYWKVVDRDAVTFTEEKTVLYTKAEVTKDISQLDIF